MFLKPELWVYYDDEAEYYLEERECFEVLQNNTTTSNALTTTRNA
jgi:hypothetical protein